MKIRATQKVLSIARIEAIKDPEPLIEKMPGEWYASIVSRGLPGKGLVTPRGIMYEMLQMI